MRLNKHERREASAVGAEAKRRKADQDDTGETTASSEALNDTVEAREAPDVDPYKLKDSVISQKRKPDLSTAWTNKQRTLVFCARGISQRHRHLLENLKRLLPHSKSEPKWDKKAPLSEINELCEMLSCNNCIFLEPTKGVNLYMYVTRAPLGPTVKFRILNVHTLGEMKLKGNCLLHSRPLLIFGKDFRERPDLRLMRELLIQGMGTPRNHPKSKPFFDHAFAFFFFDEKIFFRHYQILPATSTTLGLKPKEPLPPRLVEIGPRFVMEPMKILDESFAGSTIFLASGAARRSPRRLQRKI